MKQHIKIKELYYKMESIDLFYIQISLIMINLDKYIYSNIQTNLCGTAIPHSTILTELYNILHSNTVEYIHF